MSRPAILQQHQQSIDQSKDHIKRYRYDKIKLQKKNKPDYREIAKSLLINTPSQIESKISAYKELDEIQQAARMILDLGNFVSVPTDVSNCACVHLYNFYKYNSITNYDRSSVAVACIFMACKTEDHPRALNDIIVAFYNNINSRNCKQIIERRKNLEQQIHEARLNLSYSQSYTHSTTGSIGLTSPSLCDTDSISPRSIKSSSSLTPSSNSESYNTFKSPNNSVYSSNTPTRTMTPTTPDDSSTLVGISPRGNQNSFDGYNRHGLSSNMSNIKKIQSDIKNIKNELENMPIIRYLNPNNKKECVIPPDEFFHKYRPKIEAYEMDLLCSIAFCTIVSLPHILIVESRNRFVNSYGESIKPKIERIVYVAYDLATRVVSLIPVQKPRNYIAAALIYLCGPFRHPIEDKQWWVDVYNADMTEDELIELAELICDAWIATKDYYSQVHNRSNNHNRDMSCILSKSVNGKNQNSFSTSYSEINVSPNSSSKSPIDSEKSIKLSPISFSHIYNNQIAKNEISPKNIHQNNSNYKPQNQNCTNLDSYNLINSYSTNSQNHLNLFKYNKISSNLESNTFNNKHSNNQTLFKTSNIKVNSNSANGRRKKYKYLQPSNRHSLPPEGNWLCEVEPTIPNVSKGKNKNINNTNLSSNLHMHPHNNTFNQTKTNTQNVNISANRKRAFSNQTNSNCNFQNSNNSSLKKLRQQNNLSTSPITNNLSSNLSKNAIICHGKNNVKNLQNLGAED